ncbi:hypothetical protein Scep_018912 [Stephania cephalantha]|uniref:Uncharacterized protein n=1 Tax=Stephania cephalantha TaxID=152367 RepID=A0AAP0IA89_9MAGN
MRLRLSLLWRLSLLVEAGHDVDEDDEDNEDNEELVDQSMGTNEDSDDEDFEPSEGHHLVDDMEDSEGGSDNMEEDPEIPHGFAEHAPAKENQDQTGDDESRRRQEDALLAELEVVHAEGETKTSSAMDDHPTTPVHEPVQSDHQPNDEQNGDETSEGHVAAGGTTEHALGEMMRMVHEATAHAVQEMKNEVQGSIVAIQAGTEQLDVKANLQREMMQLRALVEELKAHMTGAGGVSPSK